MLNALKREANRTFTENGAVTLVSTYSDCLDLFATVGALRKASEQEILDRFIRAYTEDPDKLVNWDGAYYQEKILPEHNVNTNDKVLNRITLGKITVNYE